MEKKLFCSNLMKFLSDYWVYVFCPLAVSWEKYGFCDLVYVCCVVWCCHVFSIWGIFGFSKVCFFGGFLEGDLFVGDPQNILQKKTLDLKTEFQYL